MRSLGAGSQQDGFEFHLLDFSRHFVLVFVTLPS